MSHLSYAQMADALGVDYCRGIKPSGHYCHLRHDLFGEVDDLGVVHFTDRPYTRVDTYSFLKLAADAIDPTISTDVPWRRVYRRAVLARALARKVSVRLPRRFWTNDRAFVLASVAGMSNSVPMRKQAFDWARR